MSRIGKLPVALPEGVSVDIQPKQITVNGPKGTLSQFQLPHVSVKEEDSALIVTRKSDEKLARAQHGLMRSLLANMVSGVSEGFSKQLEVKGVGFKVSVSGHALTLNLGFSHPITYTVPEDIEVKVDSNVITISGIDKQKVGHVAAEIRALKKPEPYKGKGIKYVDEQIIRKSGKAAAGGEGA